MTKTPVHIPGPEEGPPFPPTAALAAALATEMPTARRRREGWVGRLVTLLAVTLSLYAIYWVVAIVPPQIYRVSFLMLALILTFLVYPLGTGRRRGMVDAGLIALAIASMAWPLIDFDEFTYRAATPNSIDLVLGTVAIFLVLEATRRTVGAILPVTALGFLLYAYWGPLFELVGMDVIAHRGYYPERLVGTLYITLEGIFGVPLDVAATYIVLFTLFGAILEASGAGKFFIDWAMAAFGRSGTGAGPGRTVIGAGFLLGAVSGSGVATTVTLGSVSWPLLRRSGYPPDVAGGVLAAGGIGAILSPPTMGAAAFLIAEFLEIPYLEVLSMAVIPTLLYYLSALLMIEADSHRLGTRGADLDIPPLRALTLRYGYHFIPLVVVVALMVGGLSAFRAVAWAMVAATALSFIRRETALTPRRLLGAFEAGGLGVLSVAATTATAGIIVGVVTLTGLGLKIAGIIVDFAGGSVFLTVLYAALAVWLLGLAVPVTASYIIAAVMIAPALVQVGVPLLGAHMFIFYYAVLSEVSPPTALSAFAASAITGGNPFRTMMITWKYTLPAFLVPFVFTLSPGGMGLLLHAPLPDIVRATLTAAIGVVALAIAFGGWLRGAVAMPERILAGVAGALLFMADVRTDLAGFVILSLALIIHAVRLSRARASRMANTPG